MYLVFYLHLVVSLPPYVLFEDTLVIDFSFMLIDLNYITQSSNGHVILIRMKQEIKNINDCRSVYQINNTDFLLIFTMLHNHIFISDLLKAVFLIKDKGAYIVFESYVNIGF